MARTSTRQVADRLNRLRIPSAPDQFAEIGGEGLADDPRKKCKNHKCAFDATFGR